MYLHLIMNLTCTILLELFYFKPCPFTYLYIQLPTSNEIPPLAFKLGQVSSPFKQTNKQANRQTNKPFFDNALPSTYYISFLGKFIKRTVSTKCFHFSSSDCILSPLQSGFYLPCSTETVLI